MQRLRHPVRSITEPFGKAGLTVAILALVMAMVGGAYAATKLNSTQKKEVEKIAKKYAGKPGAPGATGPAGTNGTNGTNGKDGAPGQNGTSVTGVPILTSSTTCNHLGGTAYTSASGTENVCNGQTGFTSTLPKGKTETGLWGIPAVKAGPPVGSFIELPVASYPIRLPAPPAAVHLINEEGEEVHFGGPPTPQTACLGTAEEPTAKPDNLCVYEINIFNLQTGSDAFFHVSQVGAFLQAKITGELIAANGSWAVTAAE